MRTWAVTLLFSFSISITTALYTNGRRLEPGTLKGTLVGRVFDHRERLRNAQMDADLSMDDDDYENQAVVLLDNDDDMEETDTNDDKQFDDDSDEALLDDDDDDDNEEQDMSG